MSLEDFKKYLPTYLNSDSSNSLFEELKSFPSNIDSRLYSKVLENEKIIFQGDGLKDLLVVNLEKREFKSSNSIIISNTCDIDIANQRLFPSRIIYAPIIDLGIYENSLRKKFDPQKCDDHLSTIRNQLYTQIFYLPSINKTTKEGLVFLDRIQNISSQSIDRNQLKQERLFSLSNYGFYLFITKLSIHFTRIRESVERN